MPESGAAGPSTSFLGRSTWVLGCPEGCLSPQHSSEPHLGCPSLSLGD